MKMSARWHTALSWKIVRSIAIGIVFAASAPAVSCPALGGPLLPVPLDNLAGLTVSEPGNNSSQHEASSAPQAGTAGAQILAAAEIEPVTLSVKGMEITDLLEMFSRSRGVNIVSGRGVSGRISTELHEVPFEQALTAVTAMVGCQTFKLDNIYYVSQITVDDNVESPLKQVRTFRLNYAVPAEIESVVREILSKQGRVTSYTPLRSVVVEDRPDVIRRVATVVENLDRAPRQVLIEARIMEVRVSRDLRFGIDWSLLFSPGEGSGEITLDGFTTPQELSREGFFLTWGEGDFNAAIEALEGIDELNTLAAPRLLAVDGTEAEIIIGGELGFSVVTTIDNTVIQSVEFLDTGTQLRITPTIADDGNILMNIHPELSNGVVQENLPSKTTAEVTTNVLIKDGQTLFIGGLIRERNEEIRKGIPFLKSIPYLGALFGRTVISQEKTELITLITPRIINPGDTIEP
jgi:type II secretory pathway component GspD/PulD (secretin)